MPVSVSNLAPLVAADAAASSTITHTEFTVTIAMASEQLFTALPVVRQAFQNGSLLQVIQLIPAFSAATSIGILGAPSISVLPPASVQSAIPALVLSLLVREGVMIAFWNALPASFLPSYVVRYRVQLSQQQQNLTGQFVDATVFGLTGAADSFTTVEGMRALSAVQQWSVWDKPPVVSTASLSVCTCFVPPQACLMTTARRY